MPGASRQARRVLLALFVVCVAKSQSPAEIVSGIPIGFTENAKRIKFVWAAAKEVRPVAWQTCGHAQCLCCIEEYEVIRLTNRVQFECTDCEVEVPVKVLTEDVGFQRRWFRRF